MAVTSAMSAPPKALVSGREAYRDALVTAMEADERLVCLDSDTGLFDGVDFGATAERFINLGIAEQNLLGVAAGLARCGRIPVVNTMATFAVTRALEAVKVDAAYASLPVRIAATHSGLSAGHLGPTHHCLEDLAIMRMLPGMTVLVPADAAATRELFRQSLALPGPVYLRLGRGPTPDLGIGPPVVLGRAQELRVGRDVTIAACGPYPVQVALGAAADLGALGVQAQVLNVHTVKPLDTAALAGPKTVVTVEEHWSVGGFGSAVAEILAEVGGARVLRIGVPDRFISMAGGQQYLLAQAGVTRNAIVAQVLAALG
jgi:transketolase